MNKFNSLRKIIFFILTFLQFGLTKQSFAQDKFLLKEVQTNYNFKEDYIHKIYSDPNGIVWVRTSSRILRYDGTNLKTFDEILPPDFRLQEIYLLGDQILLNYNNDELKLFDLKNYTVNLISIPESFKPINNIAFLDRNHIYLTSSKNSKVFCCKFENNELKLNQELINLTLDQLYPLNDTLFVFRTNPKSYLFNTKNMICEPMPWNDTFYISDYYKDDSCIYMTMTGYFRCYNYLTKKVVANNLNYFDEGYNITYCQDKLWLFRTDGLFIYNRNKNKLEKCEIIRGKETNDVLSRLYDIHYIRDGDYFLISSLKGLYKLIRKESESNKAYGLYSNLDSNSNFDVRCIFVNSGKKMAYLGIESKGIASYNILNGEIDFFSKLKPKYLQDYNLNTIFIDPSENKWLLSNLSINVINKFQVNTHKYELTNPWDICFINNRNWVIARNFEANLILKFDENGILLESFNGNKTNIPNRFWDIEPYKNFLLISSIEGLLAFDTLAKEFVDIKKAIPCNDDLKGRAWSSKVIEEVLYIAYQDRGLMKVDLKTGKCTFPVPAINKAFQIETFDGKSIWVNAQDRVVYLDKNDHYFVLKSSNFALPTNIAFHGMYADSSGMLWVCGKGGFSRINSNQMIENIRNANIRTILYDLTVNNKLVAGNIPANSIFEFPYDSSSISLNVTNSLLDPNDDIKIKYKLENYDADYWIVEATNNISYKKLPYGDYVLQIFLCNSFGVWDEKPTLLNIHILPPWYLTTRALIIYVILSIAALIGLVLATIYILNTKKRREMVLVESEMKTLRSQLNPHFLFNSLNSLVGNIIESDTNTATNYINRFAKLIRKVLDFSDTEAIVIAEEIKWIKDYLELESIRLNERLIWAVHLDDDIDLNTRIPTMITQPIIENSIIHGIGPKNDGGNIQVSYTLNPDKKSITCVIIDDGVGRHAANPKKNGHISKGSYITMKRMEHLSKKFGMKCSIDFVDLKDAKGNALGTKVILVLPII